MSLRRKLLEIKANWEKWEDRLAIAAEGLFAAAVAANVGRFFSVRKVPFHYARRTQQQFSADDFRFDFSYRFAYALRK